jgi:hypothetical protein
LKRLSSDAAFKVNCFVEVLQELLTLRLNNEVLAALAPLMFDHMIREHCYYLNTLHRLGQLRSAPDCTSPDSPRIEI